MEVERFCTLGSERLALPDRTQASVDEIFFGQGRHHQAGLSVRRESCSTPEGGALSVPKAHSR